MLTIPACSCQGLLRIAEMLLSALDLRLTFVTVTVRVTGVCWKVAPLFGSRADAGCWKQASNDHCGNSLGVCGSQSS